MTKQNTRRSLKIFLLNSLKNDPFETKLDSKIQSMNLLKIRQLYLVLIFSLILIGHQQIKAQQSREYKAPVKVLKAIAPTFIPFVLDETGVAEIVVEAKINSEGNVTATKTIAFTLFTDLSVEQTARQWVFERNTNRKERTAKIKFVFRIMPRDTDSTNLTTIFRYPFEVEVRSRVFDSQKTSSPL